MPFYVLHLLHRLPASPLIVTYSTLFFFYQMTTLLPYTLFFLYSFFFFLNDTAPPKIYPLPLPDPLPILIVAGPCGGAPGGVTTAVPKSRPYSSRRADRGAVNSL